MFYTQSGECADRGACEPVCPAGAIVCEDDVPGQWAQFTGENAKFSGQPGSPGGAAKTGPLPGGTDHVASYVTSWSPPCPCVRYRIVAASAVARCPAARPPPGSR